MRRIISTRLFVLMAALLLSACGGGEGTFFGDREVNNSGDSSLPVPVTLGSLTIIPGGRELSNLDSDPSDLQAGIPFTILARDTKFNALSGVPVSVVASSGLITIDSGNLVVDPQTRLNVAVTDAFGIIRGRLTTGGDTSLRTIQIQVRAGAVSAITDSTNSITVIPGVSDEPVATVSRIQLIANSTVLPSDADSVDEGISLIALAIDANGNLVQNVPMQFILQSQTTGGQAPGAIQVVRAVTDESGTALAIVTTGGNSNVRTFNVQASVLGNTAVTPQVVAISVQNPALVVNQLDLFASAAQVLNNGQDELLVTAVAKDQNNNVVANVPIEFRVLGTGNNGALFPSGSVNTDSNGFASVRYSAGGVSGGTQVQIQALVPNTTIAPSVVNVSVVTDLSQQGTRQPANIDLLSINQNLLLGAISPDDGAPLIAVVTDQNGIAVPNAEVVWSVSPAGSATLVLDGETTNDQGVVTATLTTNSASAEGQTITVQASLRRNSAVVDSDSASIQIIPNRFVLTLATDRSPLGLGGDTANVSVSVVNGLGDPVSGLNLTLDTSLGSLSQTSLVTDAAGRAAVVLNVPAVNAATVANLTATVLDGDQITLGIPLIRTTARLDLLASAAQVANSGGADVVITAIAKDSQNNVIEGVPVDFSVLGGVAGGALSPGGTATTDSNGIASVRFSAGGIAAGTTVQIAANVPSSNVSQQQVSVSVISDPNAPVVRVPAQVELLSVDDVLFENAVNPADGVQLLAVVTDSDGVAVENARVEWTVSPAGAATLTLAGDQTNEQGILSATLTSNSSTQEGQVISVQAVIREGNTVVDTDSTSIRVIPQRFVIGLSTAKSRLDMAGDITDVLISVVNGAGQAVEGVSVDLTTSIGSLSRTVLVTDQNGQATASLTTPALRQPTQLQLSAQVLDGEPLVLSLPVSAVATRLQLLLPTQTIVEGDVQTVIQVSAIVSDNNGTPVTDALVAFSITGSAILQVTQAVTDSQGVARAEVRLENSASAGDVITVSADAGPIDSSNIQVVDDGEPEPQIPARIRLLISEPELGSGDDTSTEGVTITAIVTDENSNVIEGQQVAFAIPAQNGAIQVVRSSTNGAGTAEAILTTGGDPVRRDITVEISAASVVEQIVVPVSGTQLLLDGPRSVGLQNTVSFEIVLEDSTGQGIPNVAVQLSANPGTSIQLPAAGSVVTDAQGRASFEVVGVTGTPANQPEEIEAQALGESASSELSVSQFALRVIGPQTGTEVNLGTPLRITAELSGAPVLPRQLQFSATRGELSAQVATTRIEDLDGDGVLEPGAGEPDLDGDGRLDTQNEDLDGDGNLDVAEDTNGNGILDAGEDIDGDGRLDLQNEDLDGDGNLDQIGTATVTIASAGPGGAGPSIISVDGPEGSSDDVTIEFVATTANRVDLQADPGSVTVNGQSTLTATVRDPNGNLVKNQVIEFLLQDSTGGFLSAARANTNSQGQASVTYRASSAPSANRGVVVRAFTPGNYVPGVSLCNDTDSSVSGESENSDSNGAGDDENLLCDQFALTVGGQALRIAMGTGNEISEPTTTTYEMPWSIAVTDAAGNPAPAGTTLRLRVRPLEYQKGTSVYIDPVWHRIYSIPGLQTFDFGFDIACASEDINQNGILDTVESNVDCDGDGQFDPDLNCDGSSNDVDEDFDGDGRLDVAEDLDGDGRLDSGIERDANGDGFIDNDVDNDNNLDNINEDIDGDGNLDINEDRDGDGRLDVNERGEDVNLDGILTPSNVASVPPSVPLDENGFAFFSVSYAQQYAEWVRVELIAIATVSGTETVESQRFLLPGIATDFNDEEVPPPGANSPYGIGNSCFDNQ